MFYLCADTQDLANVRSLLICRNFISNQSISEEGENQEGKCDAVAVSVNVFFFFKYNLFLMVVTVRYSLKHFARHAGSKECFFFLTRFLY